MSLTIDELFPLKISLGAKGGPVWNTRILTSSSGHEQRLRLWSEPLYRWEIELNAWTDTELADLLAFWNLVGGMEGTFRFKDWTDHWCGMNQTSGGLVYGTPVQIGAGDGTKAVFQLTKSYTRGPLTWSRRITRPVASTVKVYLGGVLQTSGYTLNASTGAVTFASAPGSGVAVSWAGEFHVAARFATDTLSLGLKGARFGRASVSIVSVRER